MDAHRVWLAWLSAGLLPIVQPVATNAADRPEPLPPAESMAKMHLKEGFRVSLFAAEPEVVRPIALAFDARGRAWVAQRGEIPGNSTPAQACPRGRITICEDGDGDGKADNFTVFAADLNDPTGLAFGGGGVIVACAPDILLLKDTNGDDVADERKVLLTGFCKREPYSAISSLRYGFDNTIWASLGSSGAKVKAGDGTLALTSGIVRFRPDGTGLEQVTTTAANTWGLGFDESAQTFTTTSAPAHTVFLAIPNRYYQGVRGWSGAGNAAIADHSLHACATQANLPAAMGLTIYTGGAFPPAYRNHAAFVCEPAGHGVHLDWLEVQGSSFVARDGGDFLESEDACTTPVETLVGPDAAVWLLDAYASAGSQQSTDAHSSPGSQEAAWQPQGQGRIYRITLADDQPAAPPAPGRLDKATPEQLVAALSHPNLFWRLTAQRLMVEWHKPDVLLPLLADRVRNDLEGAAAQHALWTMAGLGPFPDSVEPWRESMRMAVFHPAPRVRRAAAGVLPRTRQYVAHLSQSLAVVDANPQVRLALYLELAEMPRSGAVAELVMRRLDMPTDLDDPWLTQAAIAALAPSSFEALGTFPAVRMRTETRDRMIHTARVLAEHYARGVPSLTVGELITALNVADSALAVAILEGLRAGWPTGHRPPRGRLEEDFIQLLHTLPTAGKAHTIALASGWGVRGQLPDEVVLIKRALIDQLVKSKLSDADRIEAARTLVLMTPERVTSTGVFEISSTADRPALTAGLVDAFSLCTSIRVGDHILYRWPQFKATGRRAQIDLLLRRVHWTRSLLEAIENRIVAPTDPSPDQVQRLINHPDPEIAERARTIFRLTRRLPDPNRARVLADRIPLTREPGDPAHGLAVFRANCAQCHGNGKMGAEIGPDLARVAGRSKTELLTDILDPDRTVEPRFRRTTVLLRDGRILTGLLTEEEDRPAQLLDSLGYQRPLPPAEIAEIRRSPRSLMPEGFELLPAADLSSLLEYLTQQRK